jgi:hypothetical protein
MKPAQLIVCTMAIALAFTTTACSAGVSGAASGVTNQLPDETDMEGSPNLDYGSAPTDRTLQAEAALIEPVITTATKAAALAKYSHLDPKKLVDRNLLAKTLLYLDANPTRFPNKNFITVVNFSIKSNKARLFNINMKDGSVQAVHVAHGSKSDPNGDGIPEKFSNENNSNMSSLGVYRASEVYASSKFKYAMRLDGLSATNSNARMRAVVFHSAWYVWESDLMSPGKTYGCLGVSESVAEKMIAKIKDGSIIYAGLSTDK